MPVLEFVCDLNAPLQKVWDFHDTIDTLFKLTPPDTKARLGGAPEPMRVGVVYKLKLRRWGLPVPTWYAEIIAYDPPHKFADRQVPGHGPFRAWQHEHLFAALSESRTRLTDRVTYTLPFGPLGVLADKLFVRRDLEKMFAYRHKVTRESLEANAPAVQ